MPTFRDGETNIDFILVYSEDDENERHKEMRKTFESHLAKEGMRFETEWLPCDASDHGGTSFIKINASWETLCRWAQISRLKKPFVRNDIFNNNRTTRGVIEKVYQSQNDYLTGCFKETNYTYDTHENDESFFTATFDKNRLDSFLMESKETFFTKTERYRLVNNILQITSYGENENDIGISQLLSEGAYLDAYPPHEGTWKLPKEGSALGPRQTLYWTWARMGAWARPQPLDLIRLYFGEKIAIYFAWLGFYTMMLIPASILGIVVFLYGVVTLGTEPLVKDICASNFTICPLCETCGFTPLRGSCTYSKITYVFDNSGTVVFAFIMSIWATFFIELWKRYRARLSYRWDTEDFEQEEDLVRPEYVIVSNKKKLNPVTGKMEAHLSTKIKARRVAFSVSTLVLMLLLVIFALFGIIVYRTITSVLAYQVTKDGIIRRNIRLIISITASIINFIVITIMDKVYSKLAIKLTNLEAPRTRTEFEDSYTLKMFLFQAVNYYSSIVYAAFFKGRFAGSPYGYNTMFGYRLEECDPTGCLIDVCISLAIVMILKQALNNTQELLIPIIKSWWARRKVNKGSASCSQQFDDNPTFQDFTLSQFGELGLFSEYLEMVIQFGFITLFVAAFPLAPFFALLNNIIEIRVDAYKFIVQLRRVPPLRGNDIGMWLDILQSISTISVLTNGLVIGITSSFIPKVVYSLLYGPCANGAETSLPCISGFLENSLGEIAVQDIRSMNIAVNTSLNSTPSCRFNAFEVTPTTNPNQINYWHILAGRLIFLLIFEHIVFGLKSFVDIVISDVPSDLAIASRRQKLLEIQLFY
uniref:Anoctamin n=1 Tax=Ciona savignyi TaxID=51511 RepID=H2Z2F0_CIOSA